MNAINAALYKTHEPYGVRDYVDGIVAEYEFIWTMLFAVKHTDLICATIYYA